MSEEVEVQGVLLDLSGVSLAGLGDIDHAVLTDEIGALLDPEGRRLSVFAGFSSFVEPLDEGLARQTGA